MNDIRVAYPGYEETSRLDELRATEYGYLDEGGHVYLDYTGAGISERPVSSSVSSTASTDPAGTPRSAAA